MNSLASSGMIRVETNERSTTVLANGDSLPAIVAKNLEGDDVTIGELTADSWAVVLFYRGHW
jgi:hypothetical protein